MLDTSRFIGAKLCIRRTRVFKDGIVSTPLLRFNPEGPVLLSERILAKLIAAVRDPNPPYEHSFIFTESDYFEREGEMSDRLRTTEIRQAIPDALDVMDAIDAMPEDVVRAVADYAGMSLAQREARRSVGTQALAAKVGRLKE